MDLLSGTRNADDDRLAPALVGAAQGLAHHVDVPDALKREIDAALRHLDDRIRGVFDSGRIERVGGAQLAREFEAAGVQCRNCHKIGDQGKEVGPALNEIGKKYKRAELLETILEPSKKIEPKYLLYLVETTAGQIHTGLLVSKTDDEVVLKSAENKLIRLKRSDVELLVPQQKSMMPDLLLRDMTAAQVADLTAYLSSLK